MALKGSKNGCIVLKLSDKAFISPAKLHAKACKGFFDPFLQRTIIEFEELRVDNWRFFVAGKCFVNVI